METNNNFSTEELTSGFSENTNIVRCIKNIKNLNNVENRKLFEKKYLPIVLNEEKKRSPFLSVIIRTQGKREDGLRESLLCMHAQSNQDFEIILIAHKVNPRQENVILEVLEDQDAEFREKIRYFRLDEGTRTTPLNFGFAHAWGKYVAIFDDDDILFQNWVECFAECANKADGRILHSFAFAQKWENVDKLGYRANTAPAAHYCKEFDLLTQLTVNKCPLMTLAFPANVFQNVGIIFDEKLNVMEDWEFFMRVAFLCGVSDICEPTAIYRFWDNIETSATLHNQDNWTKTYQAIQESFDHYDIVLPAGNIKRIIEMSGSGDNNNILGKDGEMVSQLFYSNGQPFNSHQVLLASNKVRYPQIDIWFLFEQKTSDLTAMRVDLCEEGLFVLNNFAVDVWFTNGEKRTLGIKDCVHNGIEHGESVLFISSDPEIVWEWNDERLVDVVNVRGNFSRQIPRISFLNWVINLLPLNKCIKKRELHKKGYF